MERTRGSIRLDLVLSLYRQAVDLDESFGRAVVKLVRAVIRRQPMIIQCLGRLAANYRGSTLMQAHSDITGYKPLGTLDVGI